MPLDRGPDQVRFRERPFPSPWGSWPWYVVVCMAVAGGIGTVPVGDGVGGGEDQTASLHALGPDQAVGQFPNRRGRSAQKDHFQAAVSIEVDMGGRHHPFKMGVLKLGQPLGHPGGVMVVDERQDPHRLALILRDRLLHQGGAHQAPNRFAAVGKPVLLAVVVELLEEFATDRDTEADQRIFHDGSWAVNEGLRTVSHQPGRMN